MLKIQIKDEPHLNLPLFAVAVIGISWSIGYIKDKRIKLIVKVVWIALLVLFFLWYSLEFWKPEVVLEVVP